MKQTLFQNMLKAAGAFLFAVTLSAGFTACTDTIDNPATPENPSELSQGVDPTPEPTEDAVAVTTDCSFVMFGEIEDEMGEAISRRLKGTFDMPSMAQLYFLDPQRGKDLGMGEESWQELVRRTRNGEAALILSQCTFSDFHTFTKYYIQGMMELAAMQYVGDDPDAKPDTEAMQAEAEKRMADALREGWQFWRDRQANPEAFDEPDWQNIDSWPAEMQDAVMFDAWGFHGANHMLYVVHSAMQDEGNEANETMTAYQWGQKADAVADWINRQVNGDAQTRAGMADFRRALTRAASGSAAIDELMSAQTKEYVFDYKYPKIASTGVSTAKSAIKVSYAAYCAYDFANNVEYYQVRQNITVMNNKIFSDYGTSWLNRNKDSDYYFARGAWMKSIDTKMWLDGSGTKSILSAAPLNENGSSSGSTSSGGSASTTTGHTNGFSVGGSYGTRSGFTVSGSYSHTWTYSESTGTSWSTSTNWNTKDLTTVFTQGNDANGTVTWKHKGNSPTSLGNDGTESAAIKTLLKSTCQTDEQTLWKIQNPSGTYKLKANFNVVSEICKIKWPYNGAFVTQDNSHDISFDLNAPDRFKLKWNNVIYDYGSVTGDIQLTHYLDEYIENTYGNKSANFCWAGLFLSTEATANGSDNAASVFQTFKNSIIGMKVQLYQKGFRGKMVFGLKRDGVSSLTDKIVIDLDNPYQEGETLTEEVNGYELTFKVTKSQEEVELSKVPEEFTGELVIPEEVGDFYHMKVKSLGIGCAYKSHKITELNVPEGVNSVLRWAFSYCNSLKKVYLPSTTTKINYQAFYDLPSLEEIHIKATSAPRVSGGEKQNFTDENYNNVKLYVPKGCKSKYQNASGKAAPWKNFKNIIEE